jgi:hypothetical protein
MHRLTTLPLIAVTLCLAVNATAAPFVTLRGAFVPERLGKETTAKFAVRIGSSAGGLPPPLTQAIIRYPAGLGITLSGLGIDTCSATTLEIVGPGGCLVESVMGEGSAVGELHVGPALIRENAQVTMVRSAEREGGLAILFYVDAETPVVAQLVFAGVLQPASPPFGGQIVINVPVVEAWAGGPDVAVTEVNLVLGPRGLTYYEHVGGKLIAYHPRGLRLPSRCPHGGFPFAAHMTFIDGRQADARTSVPCLSAAAHPAGARELRPR